MQFFTDLLQTVIARVKPPVCIALGAPRPVSKLVAALPGMDITCFQMDLFQSNKLTQILGEDNLTAEVVAGADLWDLPKKFNTVILPCAAHTDRELKIDMVEQAWHILEPGGVAITLNEYERDTQIAKLHKKIFGKCGQTPSSEFGMAFFSTKVDEERKRRRHEVSFHAKLSGGPSMNFVCRPGMFSYGRFDAGSRALLEVAELQPGERVLDLGCGVGAVGCLATTRTGEKGRTTFIDSHLRAIALTEINVKANGVANATIIASENMEKMEVSTFEVILANPPYYGDSMVARLFIGQSRDLLKPRGRFYIVTKMPTAVVPLIFETFGSCDVIENRGYSIVTATSL